MFLLLILLPICAALKFNLTQKVVTEPRVIKHPIDEFEDSVIDLSSFPVKNVNNIHYYIDVYLGSPNSMKVPLLLDTKSFWMVTSSTLC